MREADVASSGKRPLMTIGKQQLPFTLLNLPAKGGQARRMARRRFAQIDEGGRVPGFQHQERGRSGDNPQRRLEQRLMNRMNADAAKPVLRVPVVGLTPM